MSYLNLFRYNSTREPPMNCKIVLSPEKSSYKPGEKVTGSLIVSHQKAFQFYGFKVVLEGRAFVKFKEREIVESKNVTLLETSLYVYGKGDDKVVLQPAEHTFPFTLLLPKTTMPASFRSPFGLICYQIVAYLHTQWRLVKKAEKTITFNGYVNLREWNEDLTNTVQLEKGEKSGLSMLSRRTTSQFKFLVKLPQSGFLPGEEIPFMLELDNPAAYEIGNMSVTFVQRTTYNAGSSWKTKTTNLARVESSHMDSPYGTLWTGAINISAAQSPTQTKGIIEINYVLKVDISASGQVTPLRGEIPIVIGTTRQSRSERSSAPTQPTRSFLDDGSSNVTSYSVYRRRSPVCFTGGAAATAAGILGPPSYSTLSLRTRSSSIETLPPAYDDAIKYTNSPESENNKDLLADTEVPQVFLEKFD